MALLSNFDFELPTKIEYGIGVSEKLVHYLRELRAERILLVTDPGIEKSGILDPIEKQLKESGIHWTRFSEVEPNPKDYNVEKGASVAREDRSDCILAVGGGSPIDCAKAISVVAVQGENSRYYQDRSRIGKEVLPIIAIPTTAGTGSEVTFGSVITDTKEHFKFTIKSPLIGPRVALLDPRLTLSMPKALTASTGMDALTHAIEGYTAKNAEPIGDAIALYAIELISKYLKRAFDNGEDLEARAGMLLGSTMAGIAFSHSDVAAVHCIAEALGAKYDSPHGVCNAVVLAPMMEYNMNYCQGKYAMVAKAMGISFVSEEEGAFKAVEAVKKLAEDVELPSFRSLGIREGDMEELADNSAKNGSNKDNPRPMNREDYLSFMKDLYKRK